MASPCLADTFGSGANTFEIEFVTIGDPGNVADTTGDPNPAGSVAYEYRIGKYEIPEHVIRRANAQSELNGDPLGITIDERGPNKPATRASWFEAAQFVNWLNTSTGNTPAYKFNDQDEFQLWEAGDAGFDSNNRFRNSQATYFLPSIDEWYKAAFYDPATDSYFDYPTGSNEVPIPVESGTALGTAVWNQLVGPADIELAGGSSPFGTVAQGGNVLEWLESPLSGDVEEIPSPDVRARRGDDWGLAINGTGMSSLNAGIARLASSGGSPNGFRIAAIVPEPATSTMIALVLLFYPSLARTQQTV